MAGTGSANARQTPRAAVVANVTPRSPTDRWAGPATFHHWYGPVSVASTTLAGVVDNDHRPNVIVSCSSVSSTMHVSGWTRKSRDHGRRD